MTARAPSGNERRHTWGPLWFAVCGTPQRFLRPFTGLGEGENFSLLPAEDARDILSAVVVFQWPRSGAVGLLGVPAIIAIRHWLSGGIEAQLVNAVGAAMLWIPAYMIVLALSYVVSKRLVLNDQEPLPRAFTKFLYRAPLVGLAMAVGGTVLINVLGAG